MSAQYVLVMENEHYLLVPGPESRPDMVHVLITFGDYDGTTIRMSDMFIKGDEITYALEVVDSIKEGVTDKDDELQLISSSIMQDILRNTTADGSAILYDADTGERIGR